MNSLYPGFVKVFYTQNGHAHTMTLPVLPSGTGSSATVTKNDGTLYASFAAAMAAFATVLVPLLNNAGGIGRAELWTLATPTADPVFQLADDTAAAGTSAVAATPLSQFTLTQRTSAGGLAKLVVLESPTTINLRFNAPLPVGNVKNLATWMQGVNGWIIGRDGGKIVTEIAYTTKINDALRKKYLL